MVGSIKKSMKTAIEQAIPAAPSVAATKETVLQLSMENLANQPEILQTINSLAQANLNAAGTAPPQLTQDIINALRNRGIKFQKEDNLLDKFANYTYHIKWSMTSAIAANSVQSAGDLDKMGKEVIAESGVTAGFNIVDLEIENLVAPGPKVKSMLHTTLKMTLKEPYGFSLLDRIYRIGRNLDQSAFNHLTAPFFLEIWFTGYNEDGTPADIKRLAYKYFSWNVVRMDCDVTPGGTIYHIDGLITGSFGNLDHVASPPNSVTIENVKTVGEFFRAYENKLNEQQKSLLYDGAKRIQYKFVIPPHIDTASTKMSDWKFSTSPSTDQRNTSNAVTVKASGDSRTITVSRGMDIHTVLYAVLAQTDEGKKFVAGEGKPPGQASIQNNGLAYMVAIHSNVKVVGFDLLTNDYIREITYTFTEYPTNRGMIDQSNVMTTQERPKNEDRLRTQLNSGRYKKIYNFIFTGENTDVVKFDIKLENFWQAALPPQNGENTYSQFTAGRTAPGNTADYSIVNRYRQAREENIRANANLDRINIALKNDPNNKDLQDQKKAYEDLKKRSEALLTSSDASQFQITFNQMSAGQMALSGISLTNPELLKEPAFQQFAAGQLQTALRMKQKDRYLEDVKVLGYPTSALPISFRNDVTPTNQNATAGGTESKAPAGTNRTSGTQPRTRGLVASVLNDVLATTLLVNIEIEIRGDPYWLGMGNIEENKIIAKPPPTNTTNGAWFFGGETGFLLSFRTGEAPDENTGFVHFNNVSIAFFGLYSVTTVKSKFVEGKFTQVLKGYKDTLLSQALNSLSTPSLELGTPPT